MYNPLLLIGPPGVGKTSSALALANAKQKALVIHVASRDPLEIAGGCVPDLETKRMVWLDSEAICEAREEPCIVVLDDLLAGTAAQRTSALRWGDGTLGLHPGTRVIATANPPELGCGAMDALTAPELSRWRIKNVDATAAVRWMAGQPDLLGLCGRYLAANPTAAMAKTEEIVQCVERQTPYACPRSWTRAMTDPEGDDALAEYVGSKSAAAWLHWRSAQDLPDPLEIIAGRSLDVPKQSDGAYATATALASIITSPDRKPNTQEKGNEAVECVLNWFQAAAKLHAGITAKELGRVLKAYPQYHTELNGKGRLIAYSAIVL